MRGKVNASLDFPVDLSPISDSFREFDSRGCFKSLTSLSFVNVGVHIRVRLAYVSSVKDQSATLLPLRRSEPENGR